MVKRNNSDFATSSNRRPWIKTSRKRGDAIPAAAETEENHHFQEDTRKFQEKGTRKFQEEGTRKFQEEDTRKRASNKQTSNLPCEESSQERKSPLTRPGVTMVISSFFNGNEILQKIFFILVCSVFLSSAVLVRGVFYTPWYDVIVYCVAYSIWITLCLPWLLVQLDRKTLGLIMGTVVRLFAADIGVLGWAAVRGQSHILHRGLRLKAVMEPSMSWLSDAGYSLRFGVVVASVATILAKFVMEAMSSNLQSSRQSPSPGDRDCKQRAFVSSNPNNNTRQPQTHPDKDLTTGEDSAARNNNKVKLRRRMSRIPVRRKTYLSRNNNKAARRLRTKRSQSWNLESVGEGQQQTQRECKGMVLGRQYTLDNRNIMSKYSEITTSSEGGDEHHRDFTGSRYNSQSAEGILCGSGESESETDDFIGQCRHYYDDDDEAGDSGSLWRERLSKRLKKTATPTQRQIMDSTRQMTCGLFRRRLREVWSSEGR